MNIKIRLWRRPVTSLLWLLVCGAVSAFLLLGISLWYSTSRLSRTLDENHTAIAVRTDPSSIGEPRYFTQEDKAFFENMDSVKAVRSHTVSAAVSPSFSPVTEINKNRSFRSNGNPLPYCLTSFIVYMNNVEERNNALYLDMILGRTMLISEGTTPIRRDTRDPYSIRVRMSRPPSSVPKGCAAALASVIKLK